MKYQCELCNYSTDIKFAHNRHLTSQKHIKKFDEKEKERINTSRMHHVIITGAPSKKSYICQFCNNAFANAGNLARHNKSCSNKKEMETNYMKDMEQYKKEIEHLKELNKLLKTDKKSLELDKQNLNNNINHYKSLLNNAGIVIKKSVSALSYVAQNYKDAPQLDKLDDYSYLQFKDENDEFDLLETVFIEHQNGNLHEYIGNIIVDAYKKDNPDEQSLWSSDTTRLTYIIRDILHKKIDWTVDKKGEKTTRYIIKPILEYLLKLLIKYIDENGIENYVSGPIYIYEKKVNDMNTVQYIIADIKNNVLAQKIIKYIAPSFYLTRSDELIET